MKIADIPSRFNVPFANAAGVGYVRTVPEASQVGIQNGAASLETGFPPLNWLPVGAGGVPPFGQDMNGIIKQITQWSRWQGAGNSTPYNSAFATAIGGYPLGSILSSATAGVLWLSTVDDNTSNPDTGGAGWLQIASVSGAQSGAWNYAVAGGSANAITATLSPVPPAVNAGFVIRLKLTATNTASVSLNVNGTGAKPVVLIGSKALSGGELVQGSVVSFQYDGTSWIAGDGVSAASYSGQILYSTAGAVSFTVPDGVTLINIELWGGGAGGGGVGVGGNGSAGGGGAGGYARKRLAVTPGQVLTGSVGAGGTRGGTGGAGGNGGSTTFGGCTCSGGNGGNPNPTGDGGNGGTATGGDINSTGGSGTAGASGASVSGGPGGGSSFGGAGGGGGFGVAGPGSSPGGGGGGSGSATANQGGLGATGAIYISW